jgi:hypothetical protein
LEEEILRTMELVSVVMAPSFSRIKRRIAKCPSVLLVEEALVNSKKVLLGTGLCFNVPREEVAVKTSGCSVGDAKDGDRLSKRECIVLEEVDDQHDDDLLDNLFVLFLAWIADKREAPT